MATSVVVEDRAALDGMFRKHNGWLMRWLGRQRWTVSSVCRGR